MIGLGVAIETLAKIIDLVLPSKRGLLYDKLQCLLKEYADGLEKGNNSQATKALVRIKQELKKLGFVEEA